MFPLLTRVAFLVCLCGCLPSHGKTTWRYLQVDNVEIVSSLSERDLRRLHREIFYFNRAMEHLFGRTYIASQEPVRALVLRSERQLETYVGKRASHTVGAYQRRGGLEMLLARDTGRGNFIQQTLFHELTHRHIQPWSPPIWLNEGMAELFETVDIGRNNIEIGRSNEMWINYHNNAPKFHRLDFPDFFAVTNHSAHYRDSDKNTDFYARAWAIAHYCWFGEPDLKSPYLKLADLETVTETAFEKSFGFDFDELESRLRRYLRSGHYNYIRLSIKDLGPLPENQIREATENEWKAFHARALFLSGKDEDARRELDQLPQDNALATELRAVFAMADEDSSQIEEYLEAAVAQGTRNPVLLTAMVGKRFHRWQALHTENALATDEASELVNILQPTLRYRRSQPAAVSLMILVLDAANSIAPENLMKIFDFWDKEHGSRDTAAHEALERIRARNRIIAGG